jgi:translocon-associated protein subunit alpha
MKFLLFFLCFQFLSLAIIGQEASEDAGKGQSQDNRVFKHPLTDMPSSSDDISTSYYFPSHTDLKLPIGEVVTALCHITNKGKGYYNISAVMGSLNAPFDFRHHYQNYSYKPIGMVIKSDEEITLQYGFQLHPDLEPVDYQLAITVFYESETEGFSSTFFNQVNLISQLYKLVL